MREINTEVDQMMVKNEIGNLCICNECVQICHEVIEEGSRRSEGLFLEEEVENKKIKGFNS